MPGQIPKPNSPGPSRRQFLQRAAILAAGAPALGAFLAACSTSGPSSPGPTLTIAKPDNPVKWNIAEDNKAIADGLAPEKNATLKIYNYADYLSPQAVKGFEERFGCKVEISTFNDGDEAITVGGNEAGKIRVHTLQYASDSGVVGFGRLQS